MIHWHSYKIMRTQKVLAVPVIINKKLFNAIVLNDSMGMNGRIISYKIKRQNRSSLTRVSTHTLLECVMTQMKPKFKKWGIVHTYHNLMQFHHVTISGVWILALVRSMKKLHFRLLIHNSIPINIRRLWYQNKCILFRKILVRIRVSNLWVSWDRSIIIYRNHHACTPNNKVMRLQNQLRWTSKKQIELPWIAD